MFIKLCFWWLLIYFCLYKTYFEANFTLRYEVHGEGRDKKCVPLAGLKK